MRLFISSLVLCLFITNAWAVTESKKRTYKIPATTVFTQLQAATGKAPIAPLSNYEVLITNPGAALGDRDWNIQAVGPASQTFYDTQTYNVTDNEVANFINSHAGTSFTAAQIVGLSRGTDATFFEVETT